MNYGLMAGVFTQDVNNAMKVAEELDCGGVVINDSSDYRLDAMPFCGSSTRASAAKASASPSGDDGAEGRVLQSLKAPQGKKREFSP